MNLNFRRAFFVPLLVALFASCDPPCQPPPDPGTFIDALGRRYAQDDPPARIVSLVPAVTEILFAIGAGDRLVGVTRYCDYPPAASQLAFVGGFSGITVSVEQIRALNPDLVILSADMHARLVLLLDNLGIPSFAVEPRNFSEVYETIALLGELCGAAEEAEHVVAAMKENITRVQDRLRDRPQAAVFWVLAEDPLMTAGGETFVSEAIALAGGRNIFADVREQWPIVSAEQVLMRRPDWVLAGSGMAVAVADDAPALRNPLWQNIAAVREGRVAFVDGDLLYRYGPRLAEAVAMIAHIIHEDLW
ncbi:MAG: cobalamin-binding protein [Treponema sp.]|nr:cobalamin-binding protein [Treponema sp.]